MVDHPEPLTVPKVPITAAPPEIGAATSGHSGHRNLARLTIAALGVVYGDIGTSPLYTLKECFNPVHGIGISRESVLGLLSLVLWSLIFVVTVKYVLFVMRADNRGEGGVLALMVLAERALGRRSPLILGAGLFGAALFFGDGIITPAISVLSAVEGLNVATPIFDPYVVPIAIAVLIGLFAFQRRGTTRVGTWFGPVMVVWFLVLGVLGAIQIARDPSVLAALDPRYGIAFFAANGFAGFAALGAVVLAITGGEALYADMGHFGRSPVRLAWLAFVLPALVLNYMGQSALVLANPDAAVNPFFHLAPEWLLLPLVGLATLATVIASQAVISGTFSLTRQAIQLGFSPRMEIRHTSDRQIGQIYIPDANERMLIGVIALVLFFGSSSGLANAYGIAVTGTMVATTVLACIVARGRWRWSMPLCALVFGGFLAVDLAFLGANALKIHTGGWIPLLFAALLCFLMLTWWRGREALEQKSRKASLPLSVWLDRLREKEPTRVPGTAVYLTSRGDMVPSALLHNLKHNKVLHERVIVLTVETMGVPRVRRGERVTIDELRADVLRMRVRYGFMQTPNVPRALAAAAVYGLTFDPMQTSYFLGRETLIPSIQPPLSGWQERIFILLQKNAASATEFFCIPTDRVVELGAQVPI